MNYLIIWRDGISEPQLKSISYISGEWQYCSHIKYFRILISWMRLGNFRNRSDSEEDHSGNSNVDSWLSSLHASPFLTHSFPWTMMFSFTSENQLANAIVLSAFPRVSSGNVSTPHLIHQTCFQTQFNPQFLYTGHWFLFCPSPLDMVMTSLFNPVFLYFTVMICLNIYLLNRTFRSLNAESGSYSSLSPCT